MTASRYNRERIEELRRRHRNAMQNTSTGRELASALDEIERLLENAEASQDVRMEQPRPLPSAPTQPTERLQ